MLPFRDSVACVFGDTFDGQIHSKLRFKFKKSDILLEMNCGPQGVELMLADL